MPDVKRRVRRRRSARFRSGVTMTAPSRLRLVFFGMRCLPSLLALRALLAAEHDVRAVVMPGVPSGPAVMTIPPAPASPERGGSGRVVPLAPPLHTRAGQDWGPLRGARIAQDDLGGLARAAGIPGLTVASLRHPAAVAAIAAHRPDAIGVACFPMRLPRTIRNLPPLGCLNVHPSLLPVGRGPEPVFWTLRRGDAETGVTIHLMDAGFDTGPILAQERMAVPEGVGLPDLERELAERGARLLVRALAGLAAGEIVPVPQDDRRATLAPVPTAADFVVSTDQPARRAYTFVRGVAPLGEPIEVVVATGERIRVRDAVAYEPEGVLERPFVRDGRTLTVQFSPGVVRFAMNN